MNHDVQEKMEEARIFDLQIQRLMSKGHSTGFNEHMLLQDDRRLLLGELINYVTEELRKAKKGWALDLGGGDGWMFRYSLSLPIKGVVVDLSRKQLELGKHRRGGQHVDFVQADADFLPFKPEAFKVIFGAGFLHHFAPRHEEIIKKIHLMLSCKGQLIVAEGWSIGPERTFGSNVFFYAPSFLLGIAAQVVLVLNNPKYFPAKFVKVLKQFLVKTRLHKSSINTQALRTGDARAQIYPLSRPKLVKYLEKYFTVQPIRYYTWLSAFILNTLIAIKNKKLRDRMINAIIPLTKKFDRFFRRGFFKKYFHLYSITAVKRK